MGLACACRRPVPALVPTNMALRSGEPVAAAATALFVLALQQPPQRQLTPADFAVAGAFVGASTPAYIRVAPFPRRPSAFRVAVDLPAGYCGQATISLREPGLIRLAGGSAGACARDTAAVTWTRLCGPAASALVLQSGVEVNDLGGLAQEQCLAPLVA